MTFYYHADEDELVGNNAFDDEYGYAEQRDDGSLVMDVEYIMEEGRGLGKLREMRRAIDRAIEEHGGES